jgi:hypothetical protein
MYGTGRSTGRRKCRGAARTFIALLALALAATAGSGLAAASAAPGASAATAGEPGAPRAQSQSDAQPRLGECAAGELCLWTRSGFRGERRSYERSRIAVESCVPLPNGMSARSFANRTGRPVTLYQSGECAETAEFHTHPSGSWTPKGEYGVRAMKVWER